MNSIGLIERGSKRFHPRGKRENGIQSNEEEAKLFNLMDEMNGMVAFVFNLAGYGWGPALCRKGIPLIDFINSIN